MIKALSPEGRAGVLAGAVAFVVAAIMFAGSVPAVQGLGDKVRLPMFHGASTWVNLMTFAVMGLFGLAYLITSREDLYRWAAGFRGVSAFLWILNSVMGVIAALQTWDFSGSKEIPLNVVRQDPRLMAQFQLLLVLLVVLIIDAMYDSRKLRAFLDFAYASTMSIWLYLVLSSDAARALHPDNPVMNSGSDIQMPFFGIVGSLLVASCLVAWFLRDRLVRKD